MTEPGQPLPATSGTEAIPATGLPPEVDQRWQARFRAARVSLPDWAQDAPHRCLYLSNVTGTFELYTWDRNADEHRQLTDRPAGTVSGALTPDGSAVWWFDDSDGDEFGTWRRVPFPGGTPDNPAPELAPSYSTGLELGHRVAVVGRATDEGSSVHLVHQDGSARTLYASEHDADVGGLSRDETLVCLAHSEHGDSRHKALRVLRVEDGSVIGELADGPGRGLHPAGFSPVAGDSRMLVGHERRGRPELLIWNPVTGSVEELAIDLPGEIDADFYPDGSALLVSVDHEGRSRLHRYDLATRKLSRVDTPAGTVTAATARPDGSVEFSWSSAAEPTVILAVGSGAMLHPPGPPAPPSRPLRDLWVDGPGGRIHALLAVPHDGAVTAQATVFLLHGGPTWADRDSFAADRAAYLDAGYAVVHVNYRGSTGYGTAWRDALEGRPGLTELEDIAAVRARLVADGIADPARCVLAGASWGGYLTLLGLGTQPEAWAAGIAGVPVADYVAAYEDEMEPLRAFDRSLFGGSPAELPELYRTCSPITYVDRVRAPVLVLAGANDPRCPIRQIENYLARLVELDRTHEVYRYEAGHGSLVVDERIRQMAVELSFALRTVPPA